MVTPSDQVYNQQIYHLIMTVFQMREASEAQRYIHQQIHLANDHGFIPALVANAMAISQVHTIESDHIEFILRFITQEVGHALLDTNPELVNRGGVCTALASYNDSDTLFQLIQHFLPLLDYEFFVEFDAMIDEAKERGLEHIPEQLAVLRQQILRATVQTLGITGDSFRNLLDYDQATSCYQRALEVATMGDLEEKVLVALQSIVAISIETDNIKQALTYAERAWAKSKELQDIGKQITALDHLIRIHLRLHQHFTAKKYLDQVIKLTNIITDPKLKIDLLSIQARYHYSSKEWQKCYLIYNQIKEFAQTIGDLNHELIALAEMGDIENEQGHIKEATDLYKQVLERKHEGSLLKLEARVLLALGVLLANIGDFQSAHEMLSRAVKCKAEIGDTYGQAWAQYQLGKILHIEFGNPSKALDEYLGALTLMERHLKELSGLEVLERERAKRIYDIHRDIADLYLELGNPGLALSSLENGRARIMVKQMLENETSLPGVPNELWLHYKRLINYITLLHGGLYGEESGTTQAAKAMNRNLREWNQETYDELEDALQIRSLIEQGEVELARAIEDIRSYLPDFPASLSSISQPINFVEITQEPTTAIITLFVGRKQTYGIIVHQSDIYVEELPQLRRKNITHLLQRVPIEIKNLSTLDAQNSKRFLESEVTFENEESWPSIPLATFALSAYMEQETGTLEVGWNIAKYILQREMENIEAVIQSPNTMALLKKMQEDESWETFDGNKLYEIWSRIFDDVATQLYHQLWQPLLPRLQQLNVREVVLIPDNGLHTLPFAVAFASDNDLPAIRLAPSIRVYQQCLQWLLQREPRDNTLLMVVNPTGDLAGAEIEADLIRQVFQANGEMTIALKGTQASRANLIDSSRSGNYWHFAGHARYDALNPLLSRIYIAEGDALRQYEIQTWMDFRATRLAIFSACETGVTSVEDNTQDYIGLFTSAFTIGVPTVIVSLWRVDSISTALLMEQFYINHFGDSVHGKSPLPPTQALKQAQKWLRELTRANLLRHPVMSIPSGDPMWEILLPLMENEYPFANPYFWAGFTVMGA